MTSRTADKSNQQGKQENQVGFASKVIGDVRLLTEGLGWVPAEAVRVKCVAFAILAMEDIAGSTEFLKVLVIN